MRGLAEFVMKGRKQAIMAVMLLGLVPLVYYLSPAIVGLIMLRKGWRDAAFVLAWVGSGPIKGFAVTLSTGIICSMFTAIFVTRTVFMFFSDRKPLKSLSI